MNNNINTGSSSTNYIHNQSQESSESKGILSNLNSLQKKNKSSFNVTQKTDGKSYIQNGKNIVSRINVSLPKRDDIKAVDPQDFYSTSKSNSDSTTNKPENDKNNDNEVIAKNEKNTEVKHAKLSIGKKIMTGFWVALGVFLIAGGIATTLLSGGVAVLIPCIVLGIAAFVIANQTRKTEVLEKPEDTITIKRNIDQKDQDNSTLKISKISTNDDSTSLKESKYETEDNYSLKISKNSSNINPTDFNDKKNKTKNDDYLTDPTLELNIDIENADETNEYARINKQRNAINSRLDRKG